MFRDCTRTCVIAQCAVPRQPTLSCLFYLSERTSGFAIPTTELEKACTLFTEINHCILIRWLSQPSEAIKKPRLNDLNRSALKGYKLAVTRSASTKTNRNTLWSLVPSCVPALCDYLKSICLKAIYKYRTKKIKVPRTNPYRYMFHRVLQSSSTTIRELRATIC